MARTRGAMSTGYLPERILESLELYGSWETARSLSAELGAKENSVLTALTRLFVDGKVRKRLHPSNPRQMQWRIP